MLVTPMSARCGVDEATNETYLNAYLSYSANFDYKGAPNPPGSGYHWSLQQMRFRLGARYRR